MSVQIRSRLMMLLAVFAVGLATFNVVHAKKPGGKPGGGGDPPPTPFVLYALHRFTLPADYLGGFWGVQETNDVGELVGYYDDGLVVGGEQPYYLDTNTGNTVATNLNDIEFGEGYGMPTGWYIDAALGINNLGDIAGALALDGDPEQLRGCVIEMHPNPLDLSVKPRIHLIPDSSWSHTYARRINDVGVVLGRGDSETSYVYRVPLHGAGGDDSVTVIPTAFDAYDSGYLTNPVNGGPTLVKAQVLNLTDEILTYDVDAETSSFSDISNLDISRILDFNDLGSFCGSYYISKGKNRGSYGYVFDGVFQPLDDMRTSRRVNNSGDVAGSDSAGSVVFYHPSHGALLLNDLIVAESDQEKAIWDDSNIYIMSMTERNETGFPVLAGSMERLDNAGTRKCEANDVHLRLIDDAVAENAGIGGRIEADSYFENANAGRCASITFSTSKIESVNVPVTASTSWLPQSILPIKRRFAEETSVSGTSLSRHGSSDSCMAGSSYRSVPNDSESGT